MNRVKIKKFTYFIWQKFKINQALKNGTISRMVLFQEKYRLKVFPDVK